MPLDTQWLVYWTVFAFLSSIESVALFVLSWCAR